MAGLVAGCITPGRMGGSSAGSPGQPKTRGVQEYFVRPGITQYFLLPQRFTAVPGRYADLDLVVRDSAAVLYYGLLHLSLVEPGGGGFAPSDTLLLSTGGMPIPVAPVRVLFAERAGKGRLTRLEIPLLPTQLTAFLHSSSFHLWVGRPQQGRLLYQPGKRAVAALRSLANMTAATP